MKQEEELSSLPDDDGNVEATSDDSPSTICLPQSERENWCRPFRQRLSKHVVHFLLGLVAVLIVIIIILVVKLIKKESSSTQPSTSNGPERMQGPNVDFACLSDLKEAKFPVNESCNSSSCSKMEITVQAVIALDPLLDYTAHEQIQNKSCYMFCEICMNVTTVHKTIGYRPKGCTATLECKDSTKAFCRNNYCVSGGCSCKDENRNENFECDCKNGYTGERCNIKPEPKRVTCNCHSYPLVQFYDSHTIADCSSAIFDKDQTSAEGLCYTVHQVDGQNKTCICDKTTVETGDVGVTQKQIVVDG